MVLETLTFFTFYKLFFQFQMMYSGNSQSSNNKSESSGGRQHHQHHQSLNSLHSNNTPNNNNSRDEHTVMSMKKSAEIAAIFSGKNINQRTDIADHNLSKIEQEEDFVEVDRYRHQFSESNMHSSLGYLP